jgi:biotin operon repressor
MQLSIVNFPLSIILYRITRQNPSTIEHLSQNPQKFSLSIQLKTYSIMSFNQHLQRLLRMDQLIRTKATGTPQEFASRLEISKATTYRSIEELEEHGAEVEYCKKRQSFYYANDFKLKF